MAMILLIEDESQTRKMLRQMLEGDGYEVIEAPEGEIGIELYKEKQADLVITDIIMPGKEGMETIRELKRDFPDVKIIAISGGGRIDPADYLHMAKKFGAMRTLKKPFKREDLLAAVRDLLQGSEK